MSANLYQTKEGKYYHIHGSLEATTTLNMIGLPGHQPDLTDYSEIIEVGVNIILLTYVGDRKCSQKVYSA